MIKLLIWFFSRFRIPLKTQIFLSLHTNQVTFPQILLIQHQINQPVTHMLYCKNTYHQDLLLVHYHLLNKTNHIRVLSKKILKIQMFIWSLMRMKLQMMTFTKRSNLIFIINYFENLSSFIKKSLLGLT